MQQDSCLKIWAKYCGAEFSPCNGQYRAISPYKNVECAGDVHV